MFSDRTQTWNAMIDSLHWRNASEKQLAHFAIYQWASAFLGKGIICDIGCEIGLGINPLVKKGRTVIGMDIDFSFLEFSKQQIFPINIRAVCCNAFHIPLPSASINGICLINLIHIVSNPEELLIECYRLLDKAGSLILSVPLDNNLPAAWRKPTVRDYFSHLICKVFDSFHYPDMLLTDNQSFGNSSAYQNYEMGYLSAVCSK